MSAELLTFIMGCALGFGFGALVTVVIFGGVGDDAGR